MKGSVAERTGTPRPFPDHILYLLGGWYMKRIRGSTNLCSTGGNWISSCIVLGSILAPFEGTVSGIVFYYCVTFASIGFAFILIRFDGTLCTSKSGCRSKTYKKQRLSGVRSIIGFV